MPNQRRVGRHLDPNELGIVVDAGEGKLDLIAPLGVHVNGTALSGAYEPLDPERVTSGEMNMSRLFGTGIVTGSSGVLRLAYFTARKTEAITQVRTWTSTTAAGATPTLARIGIWTADDAGALLALVGSTPNDTTLYATINTAYTKALSATWNKVAGTRYATGILIVTGAAAPTFAGSPAVTGGGSFVHIPPVLLNATTGQADLPATLAAGSLTGGTQAAVAYMIP